MKKRVLSLFMALALCLTMLPTAALAEEAGAAPDTGNVESVYTIGDDTVVQIGEESDPVQVAQALIDALPEDVTAENAEEIEQQLMALEAALEALTEEQLALLDMTRYEALCAALVSQVSLTAERGGEHADHPICGDVSCNKHGASLTGWVGVSELSDDMEAGYYYLIGPVTRTSTWYPKDGVVLCLNGYNISMDAKNSNNDSTICVNGGVTFTLCDCQNKGTVTHGMNGTAKYTGSGVWVENGNRAGKANFVLYSGSVSGNEYDNASIKFGAGVHLGADASFTMHGGSISGNKTAGYGGGVYVQAGTTSFTMTGGTITGNSAGHDGGGVYVKNGSFTMTGGSITENRVGNGYNGGGVYAGMDANITLSGAPIITRNNDTSSKANNVYHKKDEVYGVGKTLIGKGGLSSTASIGVTVDADKLPTTDGSSTIIAEAAEGYTITANDAKRVSADAGTGYNVRQKDNALVLVKGELPHEHPVCGKTCGHTGNEKHTDDIEWKPVSSLSDITEAGSYYLTKDVETSGTWELTDGVNLCLNGHSIKCTNTAEYYPVISIKENITFTLTDCEGGETPHTFKKDDTGRWVQDASGEITVKGVIFRATDVSGRGVGVSGGTFNMYGGTVCGGSLGSGGGVHVSSGTFNMYGGRISGNVSKDTSDGGGGGVYVCNSSTFNMSGNAAVSGNTAQYGSGVYLSSNSTFTMSEHAAISGNSAAMTGGGVFVSSGSITMSSDAVISGNSAGNNGGGIYISYPGTFTMENGTISGNSADKNGGGVYVHNSGAFTMNSGSISGNRATQNGGGVYVKNGTFTMSGGKVTGNSATEGGGGVELNGSGTMTVSGSVQITDNWQNGTLDSSGVYVKGSKGKANNLYLYSTKTVAIDTAGLNADAHIGISTEDWPDPGSPVKIATNATNEESHYTAIFTPDAEEADYKITKKNDNALYLSAHEHTWTYTADAATHTITAKCSECQQTGGSVTLQAPDESTLTYDGNGKAATVTASSNWQGPAVSGITIGYTYEVNGHPTMLSPGEAPINARAYTASITLGGKEVSVQYTINKAELTIKANDNTIVYGDTASDKGVTYSGFVNGEDKSVLGGELTYTFSYTPGMDKGLYIITPEGKTSGNYEIKTVPGTLTVEPREVTLTWHDYENRTYGDGKRVYATAGNLLEADAGKVVVELSGNAANASGTFTAIAERLTGDKAGNYKLPENATKEYTIGLAEQKLTFAKTGDQSLTYGDTLENPAKNNRADGSAVTYTSSDDTIATVDENGVVTAKNVGTTTITATAAAVTGKYSEATASYKLTVNPKELKANDLELTGSFVKTYDGNVNATAVGAHVKSGVLVGNDTLNITGSAVYNSEDVKDANSITFTPNAITEGNYRLAAAEKVTVTEGVKINRRTITIASVQATSKQYDGDTTAYSCITSVTFNGLVEGETLTKSGLQNGTYVTGDYGINSANFNSANVNEANKITGEVGITNPNLNYTFKESGKETSTAPFTTTGSITPANSWSLTPVTDLTIRYNNRDLRTYTPNWSTLLPSGQTWTYSASTATTGSAALSTNTIGADTGVLSYQLSAGNVSDTATWTVTASCANYQSFTLAVTLTLIARDEQTGFKFENNTTSVTKTYGDEDFTIAASGGATGSSVTYTSSDETVAKVDEDGKVTIVGAGITTIKAKASETADFEEKEISYTLTVKPKTLAKDDLTYSGSITKVYDGSTNAPSGLTVSVDPSSLVNGDTLTVNGTLKFNSANVGEASEITFIPTAITTGNYTLAATEALTIRSASITAKEVTLTSGINATNRSYAKDNKTVALTKGTLAFTGLVSGETLDVNIPDTGTIFDTKVGTYNVTYSGVTLKDGTTGKASNYKLVGSLPTVTVTISKAAAPVLADIPVSFKYTVTTGEKAIGNAGIPADAGTLTYSKGTATKTGTVTVTSWDVDSTTGKVTYTLSGGKAGDSATLFVTIASTNYEDATVNVVITLTARDNQVELRITGGTTVVYGQTLALNTSGGSGSGAVTYTVVNGTGEATIDPNTGVLTPVKVGSVSVIATKAGDNDYNAVTSAPVEITITKATPTGEPKYTEIKTGGKTLADAALTIEGSTLKPNAGTLEWVDDKGNVLSNDTKVEANTTYKWRFTPTDGSYTVLTGSIELYHKSSSSGGWYYTYYTIKATAGTNGSISPSGWTSVRDGWDQTFTITPDKGYAVAKVLVDGKSVGAVKSYTFKNVTKDHTIEAIFMKSNGNPQTGVFVDVAEGSYYEEAIDWAVEKGVTNGVSSNMFAPNDPCTRAQIVTFLWRAAGSPAPKSMSSFTDVPADAFYAKAVAWAVENGITSGTGEGKFSPNSTCTRAQAVTFLYRASGSPAVSGSAEFSDVATNAYYADAVAWAAKKGITTGIGGGLFGSDNDCTRGQIVTFLWRAMAE